MRNWLVEGWQWPAAALFARIALALLTPLWFALGGAALGCIYCQLPIYLLHQAEEHLGDRFRIYINNLVGDGREVLSPLATFWINSLGVWGIDLVALYLASLGNAALGLMAIYLPLVNALGHLIPAVIQRRANPGLWTALLLFVPLGILSLTIVQRATHAGWPFHALGLGVALAVHGAILVHVRHQLRRKSGPILMDK